VTAARYGLVALWYSAYGMQHPKNKQTNKQTKKPTKYDNTDTFY